MIAGKVEAIQIAAEAAAPMEEVAEVEAVGGHGLAGDRYHKGVGTFSHIPKPRGVTLIEAEALAAVNQGGLPLNYAECRRNIITSGVALNELVGREFQVGSVTLRGIELCEPCDHLAGLAGKPLIAPLVHRGGLRAEVVSSGTIRRGDSLSS